MKSRYALQLENWAKLNPDFVVPKFQLPELPKFQLPKLTIPSPTEEELRAFDEQAKRLRIGKYTGNDPPWRFR